VVAITGAETRNRALEEIAPGRRAAAIPDTAA
jgi:hypothetical protein